MVDVDNPTIENLQTLLLLSQAFFAHGLGKKAYMTFCKLTHSRETVENADHQPSAWPW